MSQQKNSLYLCIIIVNYRTPKLVIDCLNSLVSEISSLPPSKVIIVDNNSGDDSVDLIQDAISSSHWQDWVELLKSEVNGGFSYGNNLGIKKIDADNYLLLNSDTIIHSGAIATLLDALTKYPEGGIFSPRLEWLDGEPQISCFRNRSPINELINSAKTGIITKILNKYDVPLPLTDQVMEVEWTSFACVLIRKEVIEKIGLMDEDYFMYFDDIDYCRRTREAGWQIIHYPFARVVHLRGGSGSVKKDIATRKRPPAYLYASRSRYFAKFYGILGLWIANLLWLVGRSVSYIREIFERKPPQTCTLEARDIWLNWYNPLKPYLQEDQKDEQKA
ncbi:glycosyltransferase family 2 protein [Cyanobacterium aponinum AL20118]|uniref:Glycosyltransferase family 2 protein n=1 Tax=Cyanobacterium aponinum AL20115 TaxID=3090662 RepID=A0AAF0ZA97_9CHRO|nr:glycosyltransferase family 2 protein [Cyanobacterium aponinum]WPF89311.1 glycosyltransferase family 2 protein [Cyanobacterium aponinum AL20115]